MKLIGLGALRRAALLAALACSAALAGATSSAAQWGWGAPQREEPCILDRCGDRAPPARGPQRGGDDRRAPANGAPGKFDFYVLALSWSATFCALEGAEKGREQCADGGRKGFIVHGLWPQFERGFPSNCAHPVRNPPRAAMEIARDVFPEQGLARYQWRKHGACSGRSPTEYFAEVRRARARVTIPESFKAPSSPLRMDTNQVQRAFMDANRGLRPGMMGVTCRRGLLQEVRVCLSKDLRDFRPCPEVARNSCRGGEITAPAAR